MVGSCGFADIERRLACHGTFRSWRQNAHCRHLRQFVVVRFPCGGKGEYDQALGNVVLSSSVRLRNQLQGIYRNIPEINGRPGLAEAVFDTLRDFFGRIG